MRYWLTIHWPLHQGDEADHDHGVWLREELTEVAESMRVGDLVAVYETLGGPSEIRDGHRIPCNQGRQGVIYYGKVKQCFPNGDPSGRSYTDREPISWVFYAELDPIWCRGFVPRKRLNGILGYDPVYNYRGFGISGLREVTVREFDQIRGAFV